MKKIQKYLVKDPWRSVVFLTALIVFKIFFQLSLYRRGFISVSADEFARGIRAAKWAVQPHFDSLAEIVDIWLPFEKYLNGLTLLIWDDVIWAPRLITFIASCVLLIALFLLVKYLFASFSVAAIASIFVVFQPWYIWLSGTPMLEMYFLPFFFIGLTFLIIWLKEGRRFYWFYAGLFFMLTSGFHLQSWVLINIVNLTTVGFLFNFLYQRRWKESGQLIAYYFLSNSFFIFFAIAEIIVSGSLFGYLSQHTSYSLWFYQGYTVSLQAKLLYYPQILSRNFHILAWIFTFIGLWYVVREKDRVWKLYPLFIAGLSMIIYSVFNALSGPPSAAPARYSIFYTLLLAPYVAYGVYRLLVWASNATGRVHPFIRMAPPLIFFVALLIISLARANNFPVGMSPDTVAVGRYMNEILAEHEEDTNHTFMTELLFWDYLAIQLASETYDDILFDREYDFLNRDLPSNFLNNIELIRSDLEENNAKYVVIQDESIKEKANSVGFLTEHKSFGEWTIFEFVAE